MSTGQTIIEASAFGVPAWLVVDRLDNTLAFGGFRFSDSVSLDQVSLLASTMSWKLAAHGLPVGGAKAGVRCRPDHPRIDAILAELASAWREPLSTHVVLGKDMGATDALLDRLYEHLGRSQLHLIQAREPSCPGRIRELSGYVRDMTGLGAVVAAEGLVGSLRGKRVLIQGAGVVGAGVAVRATRRGAVVVGMSDIDQAVVSVDGLPVAEHVLAARAAHRPFRLASVEAAGGTRLRPDDLLGTAADILVLAAGSHVVSAALASDIRADVVVEAANFGLTEQANTVLFERGVPVVPDVISSSSSAAMTSYQLADGNRWRPDALWERIEGNIRTAVTEGSRTATQRRTSIREAYKSMYAHVLSR
ncbi:Glu/Leu/Phe/Val dehydrogenase dimerization domain-containing protein [Solwaraspora sp. WMMD406]|uniref:Glu/Leu/Phe/Val dehydrogenase dimerization domain-containing protein n=1 Tax=Solwaraspora sp. WMMD406 TaxID=3016095 RepID=UPI0024161F09|nr:Glu/Leu/Phe/Val dehydrogenase dimerization domain-containing protein [Solwaraspora sp. WMMD406]MDG4763207.1 Glu/Leu/Phe/Val dehydrogenase dimerization domain-containing protein [Solwaraspora sp. WMMD406]